MSKTNVFIYGSCVSRDTFEHFDPQQFELAHYVARQSALSAYTRPVELLSPPTLTSGFQQRMVTGDFCSSLQQELPEAGGEIDLVMVDLVDERLGVYVLPDGSVITRSMELISSGVEQQLPDGSRHLAFGTEQHFEYWTRAVESVGEMFRAAMPQAAIVLLDIPWAELSELGEAAPNSFGLSAHQANPLFEPYVKVAAKALGARVVSVDLSHVRSNSDHPWGEAPFHYSESVYLDAVHQITGAPGRSVWARPAPGEGLASGPNFFVAGVQHGGADWFARQLAHHPDVFVARGKGAAYFNRTDRLESSEETQLYLDAFAGGRAARWRGDCTPDYFWHARGGPFGPRRPDAAARIKDLVDDGAPVFLVLRNPVARAVHAYWHQFSLGRVDLPAGIFRVPKQLGVIDQSFYSRHLQQWSAALGDDRLHVLLYDDILEDPRKGLSQSLDVLGLTPPAGYWDAVSLRPELRHKPWIEAFQKRHPLDPQEIAALVQLYRQDVVAVEKFLGRELPHWRDRPALVDSLTAPG